MLTAKTSRQVRTTRNIKSFRSSRPATGDSLIHADRARTTREQERLAAREQDRLWLAEQWGRHFERAAGPARVLPPSARSQRTKEY